jgi:hypothetical protein
MQARGVPVRVRQSLGDKTAAALEEARTRQQNARHGRGIAPDSLREGMSMAMVVFSFIALH